MRFSQMAEDESSSVPTKQRNEVGDSFRGRGESPKSTKDQKANKKNKDGGTLSSSMGSG